MPAPLASRTHQDLARPVQKLQKPRVGREHRRRFFEEILKINFCELLKSHTPKACKLKHRHGREIDSCSTAWKIFHGRPIRRVLINFGHVRFVLITATFVQAQQMTRWAISGLIRRSKRRASRQEPSYLAPPAARLNWSTR